MCSLPSWVRIDDADDQVNTAISESKRIFLSFGANDLKFTMVIPLLLFDAYRVK